MSLAALSFPTPQHRLACLLSIALFILLYSPLFSFYSHFILFILLLALSSLRSLALPAPPCTLRLISLTMPGSLGFSIPPPSAPLWQSPMLRTARIM